MVGGTSVSGAAGVSFGGAAQINATGISIGFNFAFNNALYSTVTISDNGYITFGSTSPAGATTPISSGTAYSGAISGFGANLAGNIQLGASTAYLNDGADIKYLTTGSAGSQVFTVEYKNMKRRNLTTNLDGFVNFQIRLYEADMRIEIQYKSWTTASATSTTGQVGLRGLTNTSFSNRIGPWSATAPGVANNNTIALNNTVGGGPAANTMFTWTPSCFNTTNLVTNLQVDNTTVNFSWTAPAFETASFVDYIWEVRETVSGTTIGGPTNTSLTSASITGLVAGTSYTFFVRSSCKPFAQCITGSLTPLCSTPVYPYSENFEGVTVPAIPNCTSTVVTTGAAMITVNNVVPYYGFTNKNLKTASVAATDTWFFTRLISLTAGNTYRVSYKYGGSRELAQFNQRMQVKIGTVNTAAGMTTLLANHDAIKSSPNTFTFHFVAPGTGNYYLGFNGYAAFNQGYLQIDEISLGDPTCSPPTSLTPASVTYNSAIVGWTAPSPAPSAGYEYYVSTSATAPIATSSISGVIAGTVTTLTGLTSSTTYYIWVRSNCAGVYSAWSTLASFTTLAPPPSPCTPGPTSVDSQGIINVTIGSINNTTGAETGNYGNYTNLSTNISQNTTVNMSIRFSIAGFVGSGYYTRIWIDYNDDGDFFDAGETVFDNGGAELPNGLNNISFNVPLTAALGPHRMRIGASDANNLSQVVAPATTNGPCYTGTWGTFEDYSVFVTSPPPPLTISGSFTSYCNGGSSPLITLTAGAGSYDNFVWNPSVGVTGDAISGWVFNPTNSGVNTYTLTATQASGLFLSNTVTYTVTVYDVPTPIVFTPSTIPVCAGITTPIVATGGIVNGAVVIEEDFNSPTNSFVSFNTSTGGTRLGPAGSTWTLRPSPYLEPFNSFTFSSNDSSQFFMTNSDAQGSGGNTNTEIVSPDFDLSTFTNVSMSFWHHYDDLGGTAEVQIMIDTNGTLDLNASEVWTTLRVYNSDQGGRTSFVNEIIDLSAYAIPANTHVRIKFKYIDAPYAWWWCIDNFKITGSTPALLTWAPTTGLWLDAGATVPYAGTATGVVYAKLNADQTYVATAAALTPPFCDTSTPVTVTVTQAGAATGNQTLSCGDTAISSNITLTGYVPSVPATIVGWQMADNPGFTGATTIPGSAGKDILTPADVTGLSSTTYIRAMIQGCPTLFSNTITITYPTVTWNGAWNPGPPTPTDNVTVTSGTLTLSADLSICSLKVNNGATVNVNPGVTLTVNGIVNVAATGALNFLDDTTYPFSGAASLMQNPLATTNTNISSATNVSYQRTIYTRKFDYTYWSSPLSNTVLNVFAPGTLADKYIRFDSNAYVWTYPSIISTMTPGVGYGIRGPQGHPVNTYQESIHIFKGTPNNGNYSVTVYNNSAGNDLNFIGNPYPSPLSADLLMDGNPGVLGTLGTGTTFYFWTHNTLFNGSNYVSSDFATYNRTGGTLGAIPTAGAPGLNNAVPTGIISSGQGFMARVVTAGTSTVTFRNSMRVAGSNTQFFRMSATQEKHRLWLDLTDSAGDKFKQLLVGYVENATNEYENGFDGEVLEAGNPISFYSVVDSKNLTIQGRSLPFDSNDQVPLGYRTDAAGSFTIALSNTDGLLSEVTTPIYIEDTVLNTYHDLKSGSYTFVTEAGTFNNRFVLRYTNLLNVSPVDFQENDVIVFKQLDDIRIETSKINIQSVKVYDVQGRLIISRNNVNSKSILLPNLGLASQVLMVQIATVNGDVVNKKIIF
ncbi:GEVED domain-containing protein [Flavobacterium lotistagni]|uniref:GEVED domain-containing protein n=1 Tax=Flavobacterium lotistagni TaxID=2709660 RepID=UPI001F3A7C0D|nr:GEVED domain-containing protein [Flavobacterium lotistagni]